MIQCEAEINQFVADIWSTFVNMPVASTEKPFQALGKGDTLAGCVHITGEWKGALVLYLPGELGKKIAANMFGLNATEVDDQQVKDITGEITNIIAGNIKSILPSPCNISLPSVSITDYDSHHPGSQTISTVNFDCEGQPFLVTMLQENEK